MAQLEFDEETSKAIEAAYAGRDMARRRELVREALGPRPGERVLDVGCGPGFYAAELVEQVGADGSIVGVDSSESMLALAAARCRGLSNVGFERGEATALPIPDASVDKALSVQVLEYVPETDVALAEMCRALRPGGRVVIWDVDWTTLSLPTVDPGRMRAVLDAWDEHLTHVALPRRLTAELRSAGFEDVRMQAHAFATNELGPDSYGGFLVPFMEQFALDREAVAEDEVRAWGDEQRELAARGEFYASVTQFLFTGTRPG